MKRGVITFNRGEVSEISARIDLQRYAGLPIASKLNAAIMSNDESVRIEVSEEELEMILDEIVIPDPTLDNDNTRSLRKKINQMLVDFRNGGVGTL